MRTLIVPAPQVVRTLVKQPAATGPRTLVKPATMPADGLRWRISDDEVWFEFLNAAGTVVNRVPYTPPE